MALFRKPSAYQEANGETNGGGTAVMEAGTPALAASDIRQGPWPAEQRLLQATSPFSSELEALRADAQQLQQLCEESVRLDQALRDADDTATALAQKLEQMKTPVGLSQHSDEEVREAEAQLLQAKRTLGGCELACQQFRVDHGDLAARRQRLGERRQRLERQHAEWKLIEDFFEIAADLEDALSRLALWTGRRTALNRTEGIVLAGVTDFDEFPAAGLTEGLVHRNFKFIRRLYGREEADRRDAALEKSVTLVRERGQMPSRLFIGWR